eukprot:2074732-Pyramimonas_sp.AAC.1
MAFEWRYQIHRSCDLCVFFSLCVQARGARPNAHIVLWTACASHPVICVNPSSSSPVVIARGELAAPPRPVGWRAFDFAKRADISDMRAHILLRSV